jgi:hypothetical protein
MEGDGDGFGYGEGAGAAQGSGLGGTGSFGDGGGTGFGGVGTDPGVLGTNPSVTGNYGAIGGTIGGMFAGPFGSALGRAFGGAFNTTTSDISGNQTQFNGGSNSSGFDGGDGSGSGSGGASGGGSFADFIADAMSHDPSSQAFNTTKSAWDEWIKQRPGMQTQVNTLSTRGDAAYNTSLTAATGMQGMSDNAIADYDTVFRPNYKRLDTEVQRYGSQAYQDQMSNEAMSGVQSNIDSQRQQLQRNRNRMGANPASVGMDAQLAIGAATAKASAARDAVFGAKKAYTDGLTGMSSLGLKVADMGNTASNTAKAWGDFGLKSSTAGLSAGLELNRLGGTMANSTAASYNGITNAGSGRIQANNGTMTAQAAQDANNPWTTLGGALISGGISKWANSKPGVSIWD